MDKPKNLDYNFNGLVDVYMASTLRLVRRREKVEEDKRNGDILKLALEIRSQINTVGAVKDAFAQMKCCEAKEVVASFGSMLLKLEETRKSLPPVVIRRPSARQ